MLRLTRTLAVPLLLLALTAAATAQPSITAVSDTVLPRSGRIAITGTGFGTGGEVVIAGLGAWTSTWTDTRVVAYVPESAPPGPASLHVVVGPDQSNEIGLTVTPRQPDGRVRWTFEADGDNLWYRPARAPDGTLYLHTNNDTDGIVYALSPDGGLLWVRQVQWYPIVPPMTGPDGSVYVATLSTVTAFDAQGEQLWTFHDPDAQHIQGAPAIGPDGLLYAASDLGLGAFALDPADGSLQWSNPGEPFMYDVGNPFGTEMKFGPSEPGGEIDQVYVHMDGNDRLYAFTLDGNQRFGASVGGGTSHEPVIGSDGTIYSPMGGPGFWTLRAISPDDGSILWTRPPEVPNTMTQLAIGPDDTIYYYAAGRIEAVDPHTQSLAWIDRNFMVMGWPSISPDGSTLVIHGVPNNGQPGFVKGYDAANGEVRWTVDLPGEPYPGFRVLGTHHARITPDSGTAYLSTYTVADGSTPVDPVSYLYAIDINGTVELPGDVDGDGTVGILDFLGVLGAWGPCPGPCPPGCVADFDNDCDVGINDLLIVLSSWD
jgi:outer membrane protein assembly factor BamB